jgi:hypothetical protein
MHKAKLEHQDDDAAPRQFRVVRADHTPHGALTWTNAKQRNRKLLLWRRAICTTFSQQVRCIRVAWVLTDLFNAERGFAHASDQYLATEAAVALNKLETSLTLLERGGAIIRVHVYVDGKPQRRIYPSAALIPPQLGGVDTPHLVGGQNLNKKRLTQLDHARLHARRREEGGR